MRARPSCNHSRGRTHVTRAGTGLFSLPDPRCTPGAVSPAVTQANISSTICRRGYTEKVRPPESVTEPEKKASLAAYGDTEPLHDVRVRPPGSARARGRRQRSAQPVARAWRLAQPQGRARGSAALDGVRRRVDPGRGARRDRHQLGERLPPARPVSGHSVGVSTITGITRSVLPRVLGELRDALRLGAVQPVALLAGRLDGGDVDRVGPDLDGRVRVGLEVVVPVGIRRRSRLGSEHDVAVAVAPVARAG